MKKLLNNFKEIYKDGIRWSILTPDDIFLYHIAYVATVITELCILWILSYPGAIICMYLMIIHMLNMSIMGYMADLWYDNKKGDSCQKIFLIIEIVLIVLGGMLVNSFCISILLIYIPAIVPMILEFFYGLIISLIDLFLKYCFNINDFAIENNYFRKICGTIIHYILILTPVILSVMYLPISVIPKILILIAFIICIPLIGESSDYGMSLADFFNI